MKKWTRLLKKPIILALVVSFFLTACGEPRYLGDKQKKYYPTYRLFNEHSKKSKNTCYEISAGNVVWSIILIGTIVFPVYFIGFSLYNPVRLKNGPDDQCAFDG